MKILGHTAFIGSGGFNFFSQNFFRTLSSRHDLKLRNFSVGKNWKNLIGYSDPHQNDLSPSDKKLIGIQTLWNFESKLQDFDIHNFDRSAFIPDANIVFCDVNHNYFYDNYRGPKIAYTIWENTRYPVKFFNQLKEFDQIWVPSHWQANITINQGISAEKVKVIPGGVDDNYFFPDSNIKLNDKFTFVVFGRWDARKSTAEIIKAFKNVFGNSEKIQLLISVDNPFAVDGFNSTEERLKFHNLEANNIKILHFPSRFEYLRILKSCNVFVSCSRSEGWNLPLIEAMACGIPSIYSKCSGQLEFAMDKGIPVNISGIISPKESGKNFSVVANDSVGDWYEPDFKELEDKLLYSYENYNLLKEKALLDSSYIRNNFSWSNAVEKACESLKEFVNDQNNTNTITSTAVKFDFETFFSKYRSSIKKSGISRLKFYEYIIPKLVAKNKPLFIIETGTMWAPLKDNMGAFTLIMSDLIKNYTGGRLYTVDISNKNLTSCKEYTKEFASHIEYIESDSVSYLTGLSDSFVSSLDLVYLDSWDLTIPNPHPSASHHLKELKAVYYKLNNSCSIAIDDNFLPGTFVMWNTFDENGNIIKTERFETYDKIIGKGMYCDEFLLKENWTRFDDFIISGANNLFFYEKQKLTVSYVSSILNNFYQKNQTLGLTAPSFVHLNNIDNSPTGLGDAVILTSLLPDKNIKAGFKDFETLASYADYNFTNQSSYFNIDAFDWNLFNWGGGHCTQRLQKAFLGKCDLVPKPKLKIKSAPIKNKIGFHFESYKRKETALSKEMQVEILDFFLQNNFSIYDCSCALNLNELLNNLATCEFFVGIDSGPMHLAAALDIKSIIILSYPSSKDIYLPRLADVSIPNSEWLYPQNVHLSVDYQNELVKNFSISNLKKALEGNLYPYFSYKFLDIKLLKD